MNRIRQIVLMVAIFGAVACGGQSGGKEKQATDHGVKDPGTTEALKTPTDESSAVGGAGEQAGMESLLRLTDIRLTPAPLTAAVDLAAEPIPLAPLPEGVTFEFRWFVDGKTVEEASGPLLERSAYKKKQWVFCEARVVDGDRTGPWLHSKYVRVVNLPPQLESSPLEDFSIPGDLSYQVSASDLDGDTLSYELISPLDQGIILDPKTGLLTWKLEAATVKELGETIEIQIAVKDDEGKRTTGSITIRLTGQK